MSVVGNFEVDLTTAVEWTFPARYTVRNYAFPRGKHDHEVTSATDRLHGTE